MAEITIAISTISRKLRWMPCVRKVSAPKLTAWPPLTAEKWSEANQPTV
jgi:hypothetical protein